MKYSRMLWSFVVGMVMVGGSLASEVPSSADEKLPPLMSDRLYKSVSRAAKEIFVKEYGEEQYNLIELSEEDRKMLIEREVVSIVLEVCAFSSEVGMSESALHQASSAGWGARQLNYLQSLQAAFRRVAWGLRMFMPCAEKMRVPFKERYDKLNISILNITKGQSN